MAKSIRSKWKRKCRAVKRERYGKKELERLKKTLGIEEGQNTEVAMTEISEVVNVVDKKTITEKNVEDDNEMDTDIKEKEKVYNSKTLRDKNGAYPVWLHPRKIAKKSRKAKKTKSKRKSQKS